MKGSLLAVSLHGRRGEGVLQGIFYKGIILIHEGPTQDLITSPDPCLLTVSFRVRVRYFLGNINI